MKRIDPVAIALGQAAIAVYSIYKPGQVEISRIYDRIETVKSDIKDEVGERTGKAKRR